MIGVSMIALLGKKVVKPSSTKSRLNLLSRAKSVASLAIGRFKLIQLRIALGGELALRCLAIQIGTWTIVQSSVQVDPNLSVGSLSQPETDQELVEGRNIRSRRPSPICAAGNRSSAAGRAHRVV